MSLLHSYARALDMIFGLDKKPQCAICGFRIPQPHLHCDTCESPFEVTRCKSEGCQACCCKKCHTDHAWSHI